jgi:parallel beta-helix repeat protein
MKSLHAATVLVALLVAASASPSFGACINAQCADADAIARARELIQDTCGCTRSGQTHGTYKKCVRSTLKLANLTALIPQKQCRKLIKKCENASICGKPNAAVCCVRKKNGKVKASIVGSPSKCKKGIACGAPLGLFSRFDACNSDGACAGPRTTTPTTTLIPTTTTTITVGTTITVNTTTNTLGDGLCSFQEAVQAANTRAAVDACPAGTPGANNTIAFNIPGSGIHTITVTAPAGAPAARNSGAEILTPITIDGSTQPGYAGAPLIRITGVVDDLLVFRGDAHGSFLKDLMLTNTNGGGLIDGVTALFYSDNNHITGNYFNTDGATVLGTYGAGLLFSETSENNVIGGSTAVTRNIFGGQTGVYLQDSSRNLVEGNYFGVQPDGNTAIGGLPANGNGILIFNVIGNATGNTLRGNVITGFLAGIHLKQGAHANIVQGNHVGVGADGSTVRSNGIGVLVNGAPNNTIGGTTMAERNVISGNVSSNIQVSNEAQYGADNNIIAGNVIGSDATGLNLVSPNALFGIFLMGGASGNVISGNVITGNQQGVYIDETSAVASGSSQNCINSNPTYGVNNANAVSAPFANNWWGDASGPRYNGHAVGAGDWVSANVTFLPFLTSKPATCTGGATGGSP